MLRFINLLSGIFLLSACASSQSPTIQTPIKSARESHKVILSYVRSYLLIGNLNKAEQHFESLKQPELIPEAMLLSAELYATQGDAVGAQQAFVLAIKEPNLFKGEVPASLVDYFCHRSMWTALHGYATGLAQLRPMSTQQTQQLSRIGLCLFQDRKWDEALTWLNPLVREQNADPQIYLALARINVENKQFITAKNLITKFDTTKTMVTPQMLWTSYEVHSALQQAQPAQKAGQLLRSLFPDTDQARLFDTLAKFKRLDSDKLVSDNQLSHKKNNGTAKFHVILPGETLYQLSKRYVVPLDELLKWNPRLVIDDIAIGTKIKISP